MRNNIVFKHISNIAAEITAHNIGKKQVFIDNTECATNLMQAALGSLNEDEVIEAHKHPTMEEFYFFTGGEAEFWINDKPYACKEGTFIKIPTNTEHYLKPKTTVNFIYWGIAL